MKVLFCQLYPIHFPALPFAEWTEGRSGSCLDLPVRAPVSTLLQLSRKTRDLQEKRASCQGPCDCPSSAISQNARLAGEARILPGPSRQGPRVYPSAAISQNARLAGEARILPDLPVRVPVSTHLQLSRKTRDLQEKRASCRSCSECQFCSQLEFGR
jgi:hypothetical protein